MNRPHLMAAGATVLAPVGWFISLGAGYFMVPSACSSETEVGLHFLMLGAVLVILAGLLCGMHLRRSAVAQADKELVARRDHFLGNVGLMTSALFMLLVLGQWAAILILQPCMTM